MVWSGAQPVVEFAHCGVKLTAHEKTNLLTVVAFDVLFLNPGSPSGIQHSGVTFVYQAHTWWSGADNARAGQFLVYHSPEFATLKHRFVYDSSIT